MTAFTYRIAVNNVADVDGDKIILLYVTYMRFSLHHSTVHCDFPIYPVYIGYI